MDSPSDAALRGQIAVILRDLLGVKKSADVLLAHVLPEAILREAQVCALTGLSHATVRRRVGAGSFPPPVKLGDDRHGAASGWLASEVTHWMRSLRRETPALDSNAAEGPRTRRQEKTPRSKAAGAGRQDS
jgi:predicted DNA-binding transcriptional regulator AlpA